MKLKNEAGFGAIEGLIIVVVVVLIGAAGWFVMSRHKTTKPTATITSTTKTPATSDTTSNSTTDGSTKYLTIKEWGVKFALTTATADAYYDTKTNSSIDSMSLRSHSLDTEADCTTSPQSVATLFRVPKDAMDDMIPGKKYSETQDGKTIGDYFYFISGAQYNCTDKTDMLIILQGVRNSFDTAGPSVQKA